LSGFGWMCEYLATGRRQYFRLIESSARSQSTVEGRQKLMLAGQQLSGILRWRCSRLVDERLPVTFHFDNAHNPIRALLSELERLHSPFGALLDRAEPTRNNLQYSRTQEVAVTILYCHRKWLGREG
jgi:hypothetical protein